MTKAEFLDQLAGDERLGSKKAAGDAVDAVLDDDHRRAEQRRRGQLHRLRQIPRRRARPAPGRQPAHRRADHDPGRQGPALLRRLGAEDQSQGRLARLELATGLDAGQLSPQTGWRRSSRSAAARFASGSTPTRRSSPGTRPSPTATPSPPAERAAPRRRRPLPRADRARRARPASRSSRSSPASSGSAHRAGRRSPRSARPPARRACSSSPTASAATCRSPPPPTPRRWSARRRPRGARSPGLGADAFTANPLLGRDALEPLVAAAEAAGAGIFALVRTSNPGAADLQDLPAPDAPLHERLAALVDGLSGRLARRAAASAAWAPWSAPPSPSTSPACAS